MIDAQALIATFAFGVAVVTSSSVAFLYAKGNGMSIFRDWLRLVLIAFLVSSGLWALMSLISTLIGGDATTACQVIIVFASIFDQLSRLLLEQFLLGSMKSGFTISSSTLLLQGMIVIRFILGCVMVAVQRPQFKPMCVTSNLLLPLGIASFVLDLLIAATAIGGIINSGAIKNIREQNSSAPRSRGLILIMTGFLIWTTMSIPMTLGVRSFSLAARTLPPAIGILLLFALILFCRPILFNSIDASPDQSPKKEFRQWSNNDGQNVSRSAAENGFGSTSRLELPGSRDGPTPPPKGTNTARQLPTIAQPVPGQAQAGVGGVPVQGELFPPVRAQTAPVVMQKAEKKYLPKGASKDLISNPIMRQSRNLQLMDKIAMVDLATAKKHDEEKRLVQNAAPVTTAQPPALSQQAIFQQPQVLKRKEVGSPSLAAPEMMAFRQGAVAAMTSATQLSPGVQELRLRSPRQSLNQSQPQQSVARAFSPTSNTNSQPMQHIATMLSPTASPEELFERSQQSVSNAATSPRTRTRSGTAVTSPGRSNTTSGRVFTDPNKPPTIPSVLKKVPKMPISDNKVQSPIPLVPRVEPLPPSNASQVPRSMSVRNDIRPSRHMKSPTPPVELPQKTAVQMRPMTGIPGNPKARRLLGSVRENQQSHDHAAMFANTAVLASMPPIPDTEPVSLSRESVIHRPRPIPRKESLYHADFTSKVSPVFKHRRSLSVGSIDMYRASLKSQASELSSIPSFPSPPRSAGPVMTKPTTPSLFEQALVSPPESGRLPHIASQVIKPATAQKRPVTTAAVPVSNKAATNGFQMTNRQASVKSQKSINSAKRQSSPVIPVSVLRSLSMMGDTHTHNRGLSEPPTIVPSMDKFETHNSSPEGTPPTPPAKDTPVGTRKPNIKHDQLQSKPWQSRTNIGTPAPKLRSWHRRIGEPCPTFSDRKDGTFAQRKFAAPRPLMLSNRMVRPVIVQAEPSPIESPQHALDMIQQQLDKLDSPDVEPALESAKEQQRRTLLESLESEMDLQEDQWQKMRESLARRSVGLRSSIDTNSQPVSSVQSPHVTSGKDDASREKDNATQDSQVERVASNSQMTLLSVTNRLSQLSSPTPPDSDESGSDFDDDMEFEMIQPKKSDVIASVVQKLYGPPNPAVSHWSLDSDATSALSQSAISSRQPSAALSPPKEDIPPVPKKSLISQRFSTPLRNPKEPPVVVGLPARPKTLKPPRRSKRITQLPDIPESPRPLENKRGTMGFFKLATGETSDNANIPPEPPMPILPQSDGIPLAHPVQLPQPPILASQTQPGSFFDHYGEDDGDNFQHSDEEHDDDFDEMTLWEIANLLKSDKIPSRDSLLPRQTEPWQLKSPEAKDFDSPTDVQEETLPQEYETKPLAVNHQTPSLWMRKSQYAQVPKYIGLAQPDQKTWKTHTALPTSVVRHKSRQTHVQPSAISSASLWDATPVPSNSSKPSLWMSKSEPVEPLVLSSSVDTTRVSLTVLSVSTPELEPIQSSEPELKPQASTWKPSPQIISPSKTALWTRDVTETQHATGNINESWQKYANMPAKRSKSVPRIRPCTPGAITSTSLWTRVIKSEPSTPALWTSPTFSSTEVTSYGVSQPDVAQWTAYTTKLAPSKSVQAPRKSQIVPVTSDTLWITKAKEEQPTLKTSLWTKIAATFQSKNEPESHVEQLPEPTVKSEKSQIPLWTAPALEPKPSKGLKQSEDSWKRYTLITEKIALAPVKTRQGAPPVPATSKSLWAASDVPDNSTATKKLWADAVVSDSIQDTQIGTVHAEEPVPVEAPKDNTPSKSTLWFPW